MHWLLLHFDALSASGCSFNICAMHFVQHVRASEHMQEQDMRLSQLR